MGNTVSSEQTMTCGIPQGSSLGPVLFLIYINDLPNCSNALTFRIFVDDTNVFASARDLKVLEKIVNSELKKVKIWCDVNKLSINFSKINFMTIKSRKKKDDQVNINIESADDTINVLKKKQKIKYLGVLLDETMSFNHHISYICTRIARNNGISPGQTDRQVVAIGRKFNLGRDLRWLAKRTRKFYRKYTQVA